jgi:hypothetical protein
MARSAGAASRSRVPRADQATKSGSARAAWLYTDAIFPDGSSSDADCTKADPGNRWGHRDAVLEDADTSSCELMCPIGAAYSATGYHGSAPDYTESFPAYAGNNADPLIFTWASEVPSLPSCEQAGDTCAWAGQPLPTASGFTNVPSSPGSSSGTDGGSGGTGGKSGGKSAGSTAKTVTITVRDVRRARGDRLTFELYHGAGLASARAVAHHGRRSIRLRVRADPTLDRVSGRLGAGSWRITLSYTAERGYRAHGPASLTVRFG